MNRMIIILFLVVTLIVSLLCGYMILTKEKIKTVEVFDSKLVSSKLLDISEFSTNKYNYTKTTVIKSKKNKFGIDFPMSTTIKLVTFEGNIKAGIDFNQIQIEKDKMQNSVKLILPQSKIMESYIDSSKVVIEDVEQGLLSKDVSQEIIEAINKSKNDMEVGLVKDGFLKKSDDRVKEILGVFMKEMGFTQVNFESKN